MFRSPSLQPPDAQRSTEALPMQYSGSESSRRSTASANNPANFFCPSPREGPQSQRGSDAECPGSDERYYSTARAGRYMPEGSPLPFIPSEDSNVTVNSPMSFTRPVPGSDLTPTELELNSSLERNGIHGSSTQSLGPTFPRVSRASATYSRTGSALSPVHEQSTDMMLDSRGVVRYAPPTTSLIDPLQRLRTYLITVAPDMFWEMHSTSEILSREGIERIDKGLDGSFYAFSRSFPRGIDVTMLCRQLYGAMDLNTNSVDGGNTVDQKVTADYAQGMLAGMRGGGRLCARMTVVFTTRPRRWFADVGWDVEQSCSRAEEARTRAQYLQRRYVFGVLWSSVSFHVFMTQYQYQVFSVFRPASDDNEWGVELKWLKRLPLSFKFIYLATIAPGSGDSRFGSKV
ncbi:uncharacterized protein ARMOST_20822 [Armillaria ostoyae]|uniref:Uncharacterized protein n=1 Tax=Armillaria ostoyae TaxID=47428 RepID=A0A284S8D6_ARMOS|nr:uncharacterized protein ARMOST_20822 [Armillaria ostoyae]